MDYDKLRRTTTKLVGFFGNEGIVTLYRTESTAYDPIGDQGTIVETAHQALGVVVPRGAGDISTAFDDRLESDLIKVIIPGEGLSIVPQTGDTITVPGRPGRHAVTDVKRVAPDGTDVVFLLLCDSAVWQAA